jgi:hypothetical protein
MHTHQIDYSRYFSLRQKVFLINISEERDAEHYESMSGFITARHGDVIELSIPYPVELESVVSPDRITTYKLTSEAMGNGIQVLTDLVRVTQGTTLHLKLHGVLELFQRRSSPRIDTTLNMFHLRRDFSLTFFRKEWRRVVEYLDARGLPPNITLRSTPVNLSLGGIRLTTPEQAQISPLSMFFLHLNDGFPPVCTLGELVWNRSENNDTTCGYRFIQIRKKDRERINRHIQMFQKERGIVVASGKTNWELHEAMSYGNQVRKP